ncbi:hypothetical protein C0Q70_19619 [Pomacea canaliculata]|uniref:Uncharacterized protein n=1 Tax=Pomacea canaliculata TaxID=400727 RepID=A0A2T7NJW6_POMCA|nr:hypothetical protein C0Q70_19619 [Pomacea canaliculata]
MWLSDAYRHCFEEQRFNLPYLPLQQVTSVVDGCMMEDYARHGFHPHYAVCDRVVKPAALSCFEGAINRCDDKDRLMTIADHSGGACDGIQVNGEFKKHVLNFLLPVRADSGCFSEQLDDATNECLENGVDMMERENAKLQLLTVDKFIVANNIFFDRVFTCFIDVYRSNMAACRNWQIPLLLQLQSTAIPSLFGMTFTPEQMGKLETMPPASTSSEQEGDGQEKQQPEDIPRPPFKPKA